MCVFQATSFTRRVAPKAFSTSLPKREAPIRSFYPITGVHRTPGQQRGLAPSHHGTGKKSISPLEASCDFRWMESKTVTFAIGRGVETALLPKHLNNAEAMVEQLERQLKDIQASLCLCVHSSTTPIPFTSSLKHEYGSCDQNSHAFEESGGNMLLVFLGSLKLPG